ncbi:MAG: helix-turn-helix transcriptional regulator [Vicinamibacterales bacterium]
MTRDELRATPFITARQGCAFLGISRSTWYAMEKAGTLPTHRTEPLPNVRVARWCGPTLAKFGAPRDSARRTAAALKVVA